MKILRMVFPASGAMMEISGGDEHDPRVKLVGYRVGRDGRIVESTCSNSDAVQRQKLKLGCPSPERGAHDKGSRRRGKNEKKAKESDREKRRERDMDGSRYVRGRSAKKLV
ncbi:hypothetical protein EVAR_81095_1 [Eumeta japonica]|uniref:Uncharacterized protein n=1 Tax=Eumeta variegata TaxID=151549 RepID=A0A4C1T6R3_EUMVA|nr:hypothetical protein EVAR_81095_1 [Eumeta japonica]